MREFATGNVVIPETINDKPVTTIADGAFRTRRFRSIEIPASITSISATAFSEGMQLESITVAANNENFSSEDGVLFDKSVSEIHVFPINKAVNDFSLPTTVVSIGELAFENSLLESIDLPDGLTTLGNAAFKRCENLIELLLITGD